MTTIGEINGGGTDIPLSNETAEVNEKEGALETEKSSSGASNDLMSKQIARYRMLEHCLHQQFKERLEEKTEQELIEQTGSRLGLLDSDVDGVEVDFMSIDTFQWLLAYLQEKAPLCLGAIDLQKVMSHVLNVSLGEASPKKEGADLAIKVEGEDAHITAQIDMGKYRIIANPSAQMPISIFEGDTLIAKIDHKIQKVRNCTKSALFGAILTLFVVAEIHNQGKKDLPITQKLIDGVFPKAYELYKGFTTDFRLHVITEFVDYCKNNKVTRKRRCAVTLFHILEKLSIFNRKIPQEKAIAIVKDIIAITDRYNLDSFYGFSKDKKTLMYGCAIHFLKRAGVPEEHALFKTLKEKDDRAEAWGARHVLRVALFSNRPIETFYQEYQKHFGINEKDEHKQTPIFYAAAFRASKGIKYLLTKGADLTQINDYGETPLHIACKQSDYTDCWDPIREGHRLFPVSHNQTLRALRLLIERDPRTIGMLDDWGDTPADNLHQKAMTEALISIVKKVKITKETAPGLFSFAFSTKDELFMRKILITSKKTILETVLQNPYRRILVFTECALLKNSELTGLLIDYIKLPECDYFEEEPQLIFRLLKGGASPETFTQIIKEFPAVVTHLSKAHRSLAEVLQEKVTQGKTKWLPVLFLVNQTSKGSCQAA
ncbi:ankyrin repeat domain-containing protein [Candidatus Neptunochlamydia vexilliferae]|uniref:Ankyrin repeat protein n=1 Tax=Candidatus Neptunichlamydia vexilliferae TaxID=1651774 RepID=A0ABS0B1N7_9BACT|nr:ankyrin repeat domain-containing protein [Candidatus Neptunochlamydia vexilliferae]MBF5060105.1 hypothetical protein [Candidatus Neptunochlamydia vexilliferae]